MLLKEYWTLFPTSKSNQNQLNKKTAILIMPDPAMKIQNVVMLLMEVIVPISFVDQQKVSFQIIFEKHRYSILDSSQCIPDGDGPCFDNSECCSGTCSHFFVCKSQKINKRVVLIIKKENYLLFLSNFYLHITYYLPIYFYSVSDQNLWCIKLRIPLSYYQSQPLLSIDQNLLSYPGIIFYGKCL